MSRWRNGGVFLALVVSQSCWLFLTAGLVGAMARGGKPLLSWPVVALLVLASAGLARLLGGSELAQRWLRVAGVAFSLLLLYSALALQYGATWPLQFSGQPGGGLAATRLGLACAFALLAWWRGARVSTTTDPEGTLRAGFRIGLVMLVLAAIAEAGYHVRLGVGPIAFPFFAFSLGGLALLTLEAEDQQHQTRWGRILVGSVGSALAVGALASLGVGGVLSGAASQLLRVLGDAAYYISYVAFFVLEKLIRGLFWVIGRIGDIFGDPDVVRFLRPPSLLADRPELQEAHQIGGAWGMVISSVKWGLLALLIIAILLFLAWLFRRRQRPLGEEDTEVRESIRDEATEEGSLLGVFLPHWQSRERPALYPLPAGTDPTSRLYRAYFQALNTALERGHPRSPSETPTEYAPRLAATLPGTPVEELSGSFARTRYGGWAPPPELVQELEGGMAVEARESVKE